MDGVSGQMQLVVESPDDEVRLLAALEEAKALADELRSGVQITSEELYTRLGMPEFHSPEGDAPMSVVAFKLLAPLLHPAYGVSNSTNRAEGYDYWSAVARGSLPTDWNGAWRMYPVEGAPHILIGA
jgi:hypothetical protein